MGEGEGHPGSEAARPRAWRCRNAGGTLTPRSLSGGNRLTGCVRMRRSFWPPLPCWPAAVRRGSQEDAAGGGPRRRRRREGGRGSGRGRPETRAGREAQTGREASMEGPRVRRCGSGASGKRRRGRDGTGVEVRTPGRSLWSGSFVGVTGERELRGSRPSPPDSPRPAWRPQRHGAPGLPGTGTWSSLCVWVKPSHRSCEQSSTRTDELLGPLASTLPCQGDCYRSEASSL